MPNTAETRITGGEWRGRLITTPKQHSLRPTRAMVRQALFDMLSDRVVGMRVVDLFAGAGTVGFEALSRKAASVVFVERDRAAAALIRDTARRLGCEQQCLVVQADARHWVRSLSSELGSAGLCYVDAPYSDDAVMDVLSALGQRPPALTVCEHHRARPLPDRIGRLVVVRRAHYGITDLSILRPETTEVAER